MNVTQLISYLTGIEEIDPNAEIYIELEDADADITKVDYDYNDGVVLLKADWDVEEAQPSDDEEDYVERQVNESEGPSCALPEDVSNAESQATEA